MICLADSEETEPGDSDEDLESGNHRGPQVPVGNGKHSGYLMNEFSVQNSALDHEEKCQIMRDEDKTKEELIGELDELRKRVAELEGFQEELKQTRANQQKFSKAFLQSSVDTSEQSLPIPEQVPRLMKQGTVQFETEHRRKDGTRIEVEVNARQISGNGRPAWLSTCRDISERKWMEQELRISEEKFQLVFDNALDGAFFTEPGGAIFAANKTACELLGRSERELCEGGRDIVIDPDDRRFDLAQEEVLRTGRFYGELDFRTKGGTIFPAAVSASMFELNTGDRRMSVFFRDISEQKLAEGKLRAASLYARSLIEASLDPLVTISPEGKITDVNRATEEVTGVSRERLMGDDFSNYFTEPERAREGYQKALSDGWVRDYPLTIRHTSGKTTEVLYNATVYRNELGEQQGVFAAARDITQRRRMEKELMKSREELELRVYNRTVELERANAQLRSFPLKLIAAQEDERRRIAGELHDSIGQTLAALKYGVETTLIKKDRGDLAGAFKLLERFIPTLQHSIAETRSISMGLRPPMLDNLGLLATLEWFCREFQNLHSSLQLDLKTSIGEEEIPDLLKITIFRIVQEALNNVAKHSGAKRVNLLVRKNRASIELLVQDDGKGFDLESTVAQNSGRSLGLAVMRERVELTAGIFSVESVLAMGTTIRVLWPT